MSATLSKSPNDGNYEQSLAFSDGGDTLTFAEEIRIDRLSILLKFTLLLVALCLGALAVIRTNSSHNEFIHIISLCGTLIAGCFLARFLLKRDKFNLAVWSYALGVSLTIGLLMASGHTFGKLYSPYIFPLVLFITGLLFPIRDTLVLLLIIIGIALFFPSQAANEFVLMNTTQFALALTIVAAGLSAQVSGELYAIAEWAVSNYRKERQTAIALFESGAALEKSLLRQQKLTEQVQEINEDLEIAHRSAEEAKNFRGQFLANMSHELRTPLNAIIGFSQTMLDFPIMYDNVTLPEQYRQDMIQVLGSGKVLLTIINDILDLSKVDAGKLDIEIQPVELQPIIAGTSSIVAGLIGDRSDTIELQTTLPDPLPLVMGDPLRIRQVLLNLYSNAAKFTDLGYIRLTIETRDDDVIFILEDTGIGISESDQTTIFEEFRQGAAGRQKGRQGAGLGLAISQQLLHLMDGKLWFESVLGQGSTFYFSLPLCLQAPVPDPTPVQTESNNDGIE